MKVDKNRPVINNRASIITSELTISVFYKKQLNRLIKFLINTDYEFSWRKEENSGFGPHYTYILNITNIIWANNLEEIAKILVKCDYKD